MGTNKGDKNMTNQPTVKLRDGRVVYAKMYKGELTAMTYANRRQVYAKVAELGAEWQVTGLHPFYATYMPEYVTPGDIFGRNL
jgi:hypothetical protein